MLGGNLKPAVRIWEVVGNGIGVESDPAHGGCKAGAVPGGEWSLLASNYGAPHFTACSGHHASSTIDSNRQEIGIISHDRSSVCNTVWEDFRETSYAILMTALNP